MVTRLCSDLSSTGVQSRVILPNPAMCKTGLMDDLDFFHYDFSLRLKIQSFWLHVNVDDE